MADLSRALDLGWTDHGHEARALRCRLLMQGERWRESQRDVDVILKSDPDHLAALQMRGELHALRGQWEKAEADFSHALAVLDRDLEEPRDSRWRNALVYLALLKRHRGDLAGYRKLCARLIEQLRSTEYGYATTGIRHKTHKFAGLPGQSRYQSSR